MNITFNIEYKAEWGDNLYVIGYISDKIYWNSKNPLLMNCTDDKYWSTEINIPEDTQEISYRYLLKKKNNTIEHEKGVDRKIHITPNKEIQIVDQWRNTSNDEPFLSKPFVDIFCVRKTHIKPSKSGNVKFLISIPFVKSKNSVAITGNIPELGNWDLNKKVELSDYYYPYWYTELNIENYSKPIEYKYIIFNSKNGNIIEYEEGKNRKIKKLQTGVKTIVSDISFHKSTPIWKGAGTAIPIFSLRTKNSFGIGEFLDLKLMTDWAKKTGQKIIQILPINDTTIYHNYLDSYPYNCISVFALNPIYINIEAIGALPKEEQKERYETNKRLFNEKENVDYDIVAKEKYYFLKILYKEYSKSLFNSEEFMTFFSKNKDWLIPYAAFCYFRDNFGTSNFNEWGEFCTYDKIKIEELIKSSEKINEEIKFCYFVQYHLDKQLKEARDYAHSMSIALKGDIPIGVNSNSAETWSNPTLFNLNLQAGAPPDDFSKNGQNWGFPTFNWERMSKSNYKWWSNRFHKMEEYFDAYRIDHILGFFRIWEISKDDIWGLKGQFSPALPYKLEDLRNLGLDLSLKKMTKPFIEFSYLNTLFGNNTTLIINTFFEKDSEEKDAEGKSMFIFKEKFNTQRKIEDYFNSKNLNDSESNNIKENLFYLNSEVLFLPDSRNKELLHPRIFVYNTQVYKQLDNKNKRIISEIHNDFFYSRHNDFWKKSAMKKLPTLLKTNNMLACGEDLGMVPNCVPEVMEKLKILSLEVQRMPKELGLDFGIPKHYPYLSVATTGTHDMNPLRAWWEENPAITQHFFSSILGHPFNAPTICSSDIVSEIITLNLSSSSMLVILPFQDWIGISDKLKRKNPQEERINVPKNPKNYWCYRIHLNLEDLIKEDDFNTQIRQRIISMGRF